MFILIGLYKFLSMLEFDTKMQIYIALFSVCIHVTSQSMYCLRKHMYLTVPSKYVKLRPFFIVSYNICRGSNTQKLSGSCVKRLAVNVEPVLAYATISTILDVGWGLWESGARVDDVTRDATKEKKTTYFHGFLVSTRSKLIKTNTLVINCTNVLKRD